ncbi:uncharacterized protein LOC125490663 [Plutella xylostella]|uniref:uncharacterized protein LOC125490663 n=1 Tax=Plutella xylostella TaxID=51655 RepID=UPI002032CE46|nr:uncharacterized protein LOC125490663 [Plutella xylostella]
MEEPPGAGSPGGGDRASPPNLKRGRDNDEEESLQSTRDYSDMYIPYTKPNYKRVFPDVSTGSGSGEYLVFVESTKAGERLGNKNPLMLATLFRNEIKGVTNIKRINASKIGVTFSQTNTANNFLKNESFLQKYEMKAFIPARSVEKIGVLRFVPTNISNEELFRKLQSSLEIVAVRRFTRKVNGEVKPFNSVSVTFLANSLPEAVYLDIFRFQVHEYVAPLLQCFKCFKFNHGAKICKSAQRCSICAGDHHYLECKNEAVKCINCSGEHLAISRDCPIKQTKIHELKNKTYASAMKNNKNDNIFKNYEKDFPAPRARNHNYASSMKAPAAATPTAKTILKTNENITEKSKVHERETIENKKKSILSNENLINEILSNEIVLKGMIAALVAIGNGGRTITTTVIKEILTKTLKNE